MWFRLYFGNKERGFCAKNISESWNMEPKIFWSQKSFGTKKVLAPKKFCHQKSFATKNLLEVKMAE